MPSQTICNSVSKPRLFLDLCRKRDAFVVCDCETAQFRTLTIFVQYVCYKTVGYSTARGYANSRIANSQTRQVVDWTARGCHRRLCVLSFRSFGGIARPTFVQSASWQSASWRIGELSSY